MKLLISWRGIRVEWRDESPAPQPKQDDGAPWLLKNSPTGQQRYIEQAQFAKERAESTKA